MKPASSRAWNCALGIALFLAMFASAPAQDFGRRARSYDVRHYDIRIRLDEPARAVDGEVRIRLRPFEAGLDTLAFDAVNMDIREVRFLTADGEEGASVPYAYDSLMLRVPRPERRRDEETVLVRYRCRPQRGLYFIAPDGSFPEDPRQIWTQGQGEDNRHWFPCYDYPSDKATSEVRMTVDTALEALSNGRLVSRVENGDGTATWHYALAKPHSSYLVMLAAGKYRRYRQVARSALPDGRMQYVPVDSWYYPSDDEADVRRTFMDTADMLAFFTARLGVPYPWNRYSQVPVAHFLYGGMENTTATVMADTRLVVDARAALDYDPQPLIAHELAHQWVGDYVTYIDWQNEWLNEGFATFLQQLWTRHRFGEEDFLLQRFDGIRSFMDWTDRAGRFPLVHRTSTSAANTYSKGAAVLHMLRDLLGDGHFWELMRRWLEDNAYGSVETHDFRLLSEEVSGRDLGWFFDQWLFGAGYPELEITRLPLAGQRAVQVTVRQLQATDSLCGFFRLPLRWSWPGTAESGTIWVDGAETVDTIPVPAVDALPLFDPARIVCGRVRVDYTPEERVRLLAAANPVRISAPWRVLLSGEMVAGDMETAASREALFAAAREDPVPAVRKAVATGLADAARARPAYADALRETLQVLLTDAYAGVRATAINGLHNFRDPALLPAFRRMLADSSYYAEAAAMNGVLGLDSTGSIDVVRTRLRSSSRGDVLALAALDWVQRYGYHQLIEDVRTLAGPGHSAPLRAKAFETLIVLREPAGTLLEMLRAQLAEPRPLLRLYAVAALRLFPRRTAEDILRRHLLNEDNPRVRGYIRDQFSL